MTAGPIKVFAVRYYFHTLPGGHSRCVVATTSRTRAAKLLGVSVHEMATNGSITFNDAEVEIAMSKPGTPFVRTSREYTTPVKFITLEKLLRKLTRKIMKSK